MISYENNAILPDNENIRSAGSVGGRNRRTDREERAYIQDDTHVKRLDRKRWRTDHKAATNARPHSHSVYRTLNGKPVLRLRVSRTRSRILELSRTLLLEVVLKSLLAILKDPALLPYHTDVIKAVLLIFRQQGLKCVGFLPL